MPRKKSTQEPKHDELLELQSTSEKGENKNTEPFPDLEVETTSDAKQISGGVPNSEALENAFAEQFSIQEDNETDAAVLADALEVVPQEQSESFDVSKEDDLKKIPYGDTEISDSLLTSDTKESSDGLTDELWAASVPSGSMGGEPTPLPTDSILLSEWPAADQPDRLSLEQIGAMDTEAEQVSEFRHLKDTPDDAEKIDSASRSKSVREDFSAMNIKKSDRDLSPKQREEWENIYASFRSHSALHGLISGKETIALKVFNEETGANEIKEILCLTVVQYRVKVLIPETELWADGQAHPRHIVSHMVGAQIDYVITNVDRAGNCAVASRRRALELRRNRFKYARRGNQPGDHVMVNVLIVGPKLMRVECWGHDILLTPRSLTYASVADLREEYHSGQQLEAVVKEYNPESDDLRISVKEVNPNPFDDADIRHPVGSECRAIIGGRYRGGVFCRLPDDVTCMCLYSNIFTEYDCSPGDAVLVRITHYDYASKHVYGRIVLRL